jgi:hypothetical protein
MIDALEKVSLSKWGEEDIIERIVQHMFWSFLPQLLSSSDVFVAFVRRLLWRKFFLRRKDSDLWPLLWNITDDITPEWIVHVLDLISNHMKDHVINFSQSNTEQYWSETSFTMLKTKKKLFEMLFKSHYNKIKEVYTHATMNTTSSVDIEISPDTWFMWEMSWYIANACYTKVYPLLENRPTMTPFKLVKKLDDERREILWSVLVFDVENTNWEKCLLVRALNIPEENSIDVEKFAETFFDYLTNAIHGKWYTQILIPWIAWAIANYSRTIAYLKAQYIDQKEKVSLSQRFAFNWNDITENCFKVRDLQ